MAASHQSGTILHHWNDAPAKLIVKNKSAASSTTSLVGGSGIPTPPATPSQETSGSEVASGLSGLLGMESALAGRNRDMVFTRIRTLIRSVEEGKITESQCAGLAGILSDVMRGEKRLAREGVVRMMSEERGIAAWGTALRMVIENLCF